MSVLIYIVTIVIIYFYISLHDVMWMNFRLNWLKCGTFYYSNKNPFNKCLETFINKLFIKTFNIIFMKN